MSKISVPVSNAFAPQPLYLYGTYTADGRANYGLFCWAGYFFTDSLKFVAFLCEDKLTRDRIRETKMFSATVVTEELLPIADFCGMHDGYTTDKSQMLPSEKGQKLDVPIPVAGKWTMELSVDEVLHPKEFPDSEVYICSIVNILADPALASEEIPFAEKLKALCPVVTLGQKYVPILSNNGETAYPSWGEAMQTERA